ncbi:MAG: cytochrome C, partial [Gammaproteobacteria bacterium]|nr:cytochrome C [Gammaproteobacteria bacterium]
HVNVVNNCVFCHNGSIATGKNPGHIQSTSTCEDCHRTSSWAPVLRVDHGSVLGTCFSCHNNVIARGKGPLHVPSSNDCSVCHSVTGWVPAF